MPHIIPPFQSGLYEILQSDGRERSVSYSSDGGSGFVANVTYITPDGYMYR